EVTHFFTVDVEEHFQVQALAGVVPRSRWEAQESRVEASLFELLGLLEATTATATFFVLGWLAERRPRLVREIVAAGHEVASHGWDHQLVTRQSRAEFRDSVRRSKAVLESIAGTRVLGFRAPSFSIVRGREWALDCLIEEGYVYDSSLYPVRRPGYGYPGGAGDPHWLDRPAGRLAEFPPATLRLGPLRLPAGGGAYFRLLPYALARSAFREATRRRTPATFYIHPWELDPGQPRYAVGPSTRIRHYGGLHRTRARLRRILSEFRFAAIGPALLDDRIPVPAA
ncbi:MAG TPA: XrtA system polysaccharide deacetylase, partial [Longimicrobiales bacterium]|nr:XrtA system polysaccharide deacetylase [Longimicrobiales bacterium]